MFFLGLCPECSLKLNYHSKKREIKRLDKPKKPKRKHIKRGSKDRTTKDNSTSDEGECSNSCKIDNDVDKNKNDESPWANHKPVETKSRDEEMEDYLQDLLL